MSLKLSSLTAPINSAVMERSIDGPNKASEQCRLVLPLSFMFFHYATYCDFLYIIFHLMLINVASVNLDRCSK